MRVRVLGLVGVERRRLAGDVDVEDLLGGETTGRRGRGFARRARLGRAPRRRCRAAGCTATGCQHDGSTGEQTQESLVHQLSSERVDNPMSPAARPGSALSNAVPFCDLTGSGLPTRQGLGASGSGSTVQVGALRVLSTGPNGLSTLNLTSVRLSGLEPSVSPDRASRRRPSDASAGSADGPPWPRRDAGPGPCAAPM